MKKSLKIYHYFLIAIVGFSMSSCDKTQEESIVQKESENLLISIEESDEAMEEVLSVFEQVFIEEESGFAAKEENNKKRYLPECAVKTVVRSQGMKTVTIDFGDGCTMRNEKVLKGKLLMTYKVDRELKTRTITHGYEDFYLNDKNISGQSSSVKEKSNANGNRQTTFTETITITWDSGETASRKGSRVSELIVAGENGNWGSRVFEISGSWTSTSKNGEVYAVNIIEKLRKELSCRFIVSGTKEITKGTVSGVLDFGDGVCDNSAIFTDNEGVVKEVELGKRKQDK